MSAKGISFRTVFFCARRGKIAEETQRISKIFAILLPIIFPIARSVFHWREENILTASSGVDVPKATIVSPMTIGGILNLKAREDAPDTSRSAHFIRIKNPMTKRIYIIKKV